MRKLLILIALFLIGSAFATCVNISDGTTYGTAVVNVSGVLYVQDNVTLCTDTYYLNQSGTNGALQINVSGTTLDCNGSTLNGITRLGYGIYINNRLYNTVKNCNLYNYSSGIRVSGTQGKFNNVTSNVITNMLYAVAIGSSANGNIFLNNTATSSTMGFRAASVSSNTFINNTAYSNAIGFYGETSTGSTYTNNTAYSNSQRGFSMIDGSNYNVFSNNLAYSNTLSGFGIDNSVGNNFTGSISYGNNQYGVYLLNGSNNTILDNVEIYRNVMNGILINDCNGTNLSNAHFYNNTAGGFSFNVSVVSGYVVYISNMTMDNPSGTLQNYTTFDLTDAVDAGTSYTIKYSQNNSALPSNRTSFQQKFINITTIAGTISIDSITWHWTFGETSGYEERKFELWKYGTGWSRISNTPDLTAHTFTVTNLNPASLYGILQSNVVTAPVLADGYFGYDYQAIPSRDTIQGDINNYTFTLIGLKLDYLSFDADWNATKDRLNYTYSGFNRQSFIFLQMNTSNYSQYSAECNKINQNMSDLSDYPYADAVAFIVIGTNGTNEGNRTDFINQIAVCLANATSNHVNVYSEWQNGSFDFDYVSNYSLIRIADAGDVQQTIATEAGYMRNSTQMTRIYGPGSATFKAWASSFYLTIMQNIRGTPTGTAPTWSGIAALIDSGDVVIFNNGSAANISLNLTSRSPNDAWDINRKKLYTDISASANTSIDILENNVSLLYVDNFTRFVMTSNTESTLYKDVMGAQGEMDYFNGSTASDATYQLKGARDARVELWDPSYVKTPLMFHTYEQLQYTQVVSFCDYGMIVIAKGANTPAVVNASLRVSECPGILGRTFGYISVADYDDTNETDCSVPNDWEANKTIEIDNWTQNYQTNGFIDGFDIGAVGSPACFEQRIKRLMNHVHSENKYVVANTYTIYATIARYADYTMRESCFSRWDGDVGSPTYSYEDMALMEASAEYFTTTGSPMLCMAFGDVNDYDKMAWDYHAWAVMYGTEGNYFRYAQPNFQVQREIRVVDFGTQLQNRFVKASDTDWYRVYSNGIVHFDPTRTVPFENGKYYWFENGETINSINITARYQVVDSACFADHNPYLIVNENASTQQLVDECAEVGALQWQSNWVSKIFTDDYQPNGHYYVRSYPSVRGDANGLNMYNLPGTKTGVHSWHDEGTGNPPAEENWTAYGRSGDTGDFNTTNWQMNITINRSYSTAIDTEITALLTQMNSYVNESDKGQNISISSSEDYNLTVVSYKRYVSLYPERVMWNGTLLNQETDNDCVGNNPPFAYTVANGNTIGVCRANIGDYYYYVVSVPHMTSWDILLMENRSCLCPSSANWDINMTDDCVLNSYCNITGYNISLSDTGDLWINESIIFDELLGLTSGNTIWMYPLANLTIGATIPVSPFAPVFYPLNPGFESGDDNWTNTGGVDAGETTHHSGSASIKLLQTGNAPILEYQKLLNLNLTNDTTYVAVGWLYIPSGQNQSIRGMLSMGKGVGSAADRYLYGLVETSNTTDIWTQINLSFLYDNSTDLYFGIYANGSNASGGGYVYWDDVVING